MSQGLEVIILPSKELDYLIKKDMLGTCCNYENLLSGDCQTENTFIKPKIDGLIYFQANNNGLNYSSVIKKGGAFSLLITNCGNLNNGYLFGELVIKSSHGFLPAIEFMKIKLYFFGVGVYSSMTMYWLYKCIRNSGQLINIQYYMLGELLLSILSSFLWLQYFKQWNLTGINSMKLLSISTSTHILKLTILVILTLIASHGVGIYRTSINSKKRSIIIIATGVIYFFNTLFKEYVNHLRSRNIYDTTNLLLYSLIPIGLLNGIVSFWIFQELINLLHRLEYDKQIGKLSIYKRFTYILLFITVIAFILFIFEIRFYTWDISYRWKYQWIIQDAIPFFFAYILQLNLLLLWIPVENSKNYINATEVPVEVIIELETQDSNMIHLDNRNESDIKKSTNVIPVKYKDMNPEDKLTFLDLDVKPWGFKQLNQQNNLEIQNETIYECEVSDIKTGRLQNELEVNKENSFGFNNSIKMSEYSTLKNY
ncbi:PTM1-like protein [Cryptosporidium canis]|uniref:PTM1-like protein n=1 Tax=Cryptosporidium canis TaxID=195482 RepID=A0A9D5DP42_9CRYT|nr:PTM1-like protein [Cryptosporidium canis]